MAGAKGTRQEADRRDVLRFALKGRAGPRNGSVRFVGRGGSAGARRSEPETRIDDVREVVSGSLGTDHLKRRSRLIETPRSARLEFRCSRDQLKALFTALKEGGTANAPMPRLCRIPARAEQVCQGKGNRLQCPEVGNPREMEANPRRIALCVLLKALNGCALPGPVGDMERRGAQWPDHPCSNRATRAAGSINSGPDAAARIAGRISLKDGEGIGTLSGRLAVLTATEFRVRRGCACDPGSARNQSQCPERLRCEFVARALKPLDLGPGRDAAVHPAG